MTVAIIPTLLKESDHRRAIHALAKFCLAWNHHANPVASLSIEKIYGLPVLLSSMNSLILTKKEESLLDQYYKIYLQQLLKLHYATPSCVIYSLSGSLCLSAYLHLRIFSLYYQLCSLRSGNNILARQAHYIFSNGSLPKWSFFQKCAHSVYKYTSTSFHHSE